MATLSGSTISSTYKTLLKTDSSVGLTSALTAVEDGDGTSSAMSLSTVALNVGGKIGVNLSTTTINADVHIKSTSAQGILVEDSNGFDSFYVGDGSSKFNCKLGDIDNSSGGNDNYLYVQDSSNYIILKSTFTGINQLTPTATLHVGNNDATVKFALSSNSSAMQIGDSGNADIVNIDTVSDKVRIEGDLEVTGATNINSRRYHLEEYFSTLPKVNDYLIGTETKDFGNLTDGSEVREDVTVTGAALGDFAIASLGVDTVDLNVTCTVTAANTATVVIENQTGGAVDLASTALSVKVFKFATSGNAHANNSFEVLGTNASNDDITFSSTYAGLALTTDGADNDQIIIAPHLDTNQTAWTGIKWGSENQTEWECAITTGDAVADYSFWAGLKLTNTANYQTDANQAYFLFATDDAQSGGVLGTNTKLHFVYSINNDDYVTDLGITVAASTTYRLRVKFDSERKLSVFVNGAQYGLSVIKTYDDTTATTTGVTVNNGSGISASGSPVTIATDGNTATEYFLVGDVLCDSSGNVVGTITAVAANSITVSSVTETLADDEALYKFGGVAATTTTKSLLMTDNIDYIPYVAIQQLAGSKTSALILHYEKISRVLYE